MKDNESRRGIFRVAKIKYTVQKVKKLFGRCINTLSIKFLCVFESSNVILTH